MCITGDCRNGYGHFEWPEGDKYIGNFSQGKMDGYGVFYWSSNNKYIGYWKNGKMHGEGMLFYDEGIIKKGIWDNNKFVKLLREDFVLSKKNIQHGNNELKKIIRDRPEMKSIVNSGDIIWQWVANKFAGEDIQSLIYWQKKATKNFRIPDSVNAVHAYPTQKSEGRIWIENNNNAEKMWSGLIYELHNIKNGEDFQEIEKDAINWRCEEEEYIMRYAQLEYKAAKEMKKFYNSIWLPFCKSKNIKPNPQLWFYYLPDTFEKWIKTFTDKKGYPWNPYASYYERIVQGVVNQY
ncbi:MAG: hypothetical protein MK207_02075 [Saprospiraceae bacterium]|nr:hypothetical protein [Saprospiraceae bacterium]